MSLSLSSSAAALETEGGSLSVAQATTSARCGGPGTMSCRTKVKAAPVCLRGARAPVGLPCAARSYLWQ